MVDDQAPTVERLLSRMNSVVARILDRALGGYELAVD